MPNSQIRKHSGYEVGAVGEAQHECSVVVITRRCQRLNAGSTPAARIFIDNDTQVSKIGNRVEVHRWKIAASPWPTPTHKVASPFISPS